MAKATHSGHCQACGRLQKVNRGKLDRLSLHGYNVTHGFFSGTCTGASEFPFETSCDLIKKFIDSAQKQFTELEARQGKLREGVQPLDSEGNAWFYVSLANPKGYHYGRVREWKVCTVRQERVTYENGTPEGGHYFKYRRNGDTEWVRNSLGTGNRDTVIQEKTSEVSAGYGESLSEVLTKANRHYADWLEHEADSLRRYIAWQTERVRTWKPTPLLPVEAKDKEGFKPTEAAY